MSSQYEPSYTNKDFNSIYVELLEYCKKMSYKWDPTASDESDPGVILLKLAAIIGDKNNYNIDSNMLELMPSTVSQRPAAKQLFDQCGYSMSYYRSAEGKVDILVKTLPESITDSNPSISIPPFTMLSDIDKTCVYTVRPDQLLNLSYKESRSLNVIEGTPVQFTMNNSNIITAQHLDSNLRLYFVDSNIAENGIFITNDGENTYDKWYRVDNLETQPLGSYCYKFGTSLDDSLCYIEFPEDIMFLMGSGINITYIRTSGINGNISKYVLKNYYSETKFLINQNEVVLTSEEAPVNNLLPILNGKDPETIEEAYKSYKRVKNTFNNLVSCSDYTNYMISNKFASNGFVCDRTNDIQRCYRVVSKYDGDYPLTDVIVEKQENTITNHQGSLTILEDKMTAFDLCVYALQYTDIIDSEARYRSTFTLLTDRRYENFLTNQNADPENQVKTVLHNFKDLESDKILLLKNVYPIKSTVIPKYKLAPQEEFEVISNIKLALYKTLNSKEMTFGKIVSYDTIYDTIEHADPRIKAVSVEFPRFETFAVYLDTEKNLKEIRIDSTSTEPTTDADLWKSFRAEIFAKNVLAGVTPLYDFDNTFNYSFNQKSPEIIDAYKIKPQTTITFESDDNSTPDTYKTKLRKNESMLFAKPNLIKGGGGPYSSYIKMLYSFKNSVTKDTPHELLSEEYIVFLWMASDADEYYTCVKYDNSLQSKASHIKSSFSLSLNTNNECTNINKEMLFGTNSSNINDDDFNQLITEVQKSDYYTPKQITDPKIHDVIKKITSAGKSVLTGTQTIDTYTTEVYHLNATKGGINKYYWITNDVIQENNKNYCCINFINNADNKNGEYTLKTGEYFFYNNNDNTRLKILKEGSKLKIYNGLVDELNSTTTWRVPQIDYDVVLSGEFENLAWYGVKLDDTDKLEWVVMEQHLVGSETDVSITSPISLDSMSETKTVRCSVDYLETHLPEAEWEITPILNINVSSDHPQELEENQIFIVYQKDSTEELTDVTIQSDRVLQYLGNTTVDLLQINSLNVYTDPVRLFYYTTASPTENLTYTQFKTEIKISASKTQTITFSGANGNYLAHFSEDVGNMNESSVLINIDTDNSKLLNSRCIQFSKVDNTDIGITLTNNTDKDKHITITALKKYTTELLHDMSMLDEGGIIETLNTYDIEQRFDYTKFSSTGIKNPLESESFFNKQHVYNPFVICEWRETGSKDILDINVTSAIK